MKCYSKKNLFAVSCKRFAFTLVEVMAAIIILSMITSSVVVVMNRCISATIDSRKKMIAFELARENMETILSASSMKEKTEFGVSELDPEIEWDTVVEVTSISGTSDYYLQAVCSAGYTDTKGESQKIEFTHWLTKLTEQDMRKIRARDEQELDHLDRLEYDEFLLSLRKRILSYLAKAGFDASEYKTFLKELNDEKRQFLGDAKRFDDDEYDKFIEDQTGRETDFLVPDYFTSEDYDFLWDIASKEFDKQRSSQYGDSSETDKEGKGSESSDDDEEIIDPPEPPVDEEPIFDWPNLTPEQIEILAGFGYTPPK